MAVMEYIEEVLTTGPGRMQIQGFIEASPASEFSLPSYTLICTECPPTGLTVHSPTNRWIKFYPEFYRKAGLAPRISLQLGS